MPVLIDPALQEKVKDKRISVDVRDRPVIDLLEAVAKASGLEYDIFFGLVIFGTPERLYGTFARQEVGIDRQELPERVRAALAETVNFDYYQTEPKAILADVAKRGAMAIELDPRAKVAASGPISVRFERVRIRDILAFLARSFGDDVIWKEGEFRFLPSR
ncbi:MAG TPA: hypothetical protein VI643_05935 [Planctomycetota bacterium]|nr:hypothetical protein [Planctomycetota bacterium]